MRIRSIHPEFWRSEDVGVLDWETRLVFIGLWSYVDDNGVGRDVERLIIADLFPLEEDPRETLAIVSRALQTLSDGGQITRYAVKGKPLLHVTAWASWQRIDRPGKVRYEPPTCTDAVFRDTLATPSRVVHETPSTGEGEKGRRGEGEKYSSSSAGAETEFDKWWSYYPRKVGKGAAAKAYRAARKKIDADTLGRTMVAQIPNLTAKGSDFCPHAASWLNAERWLDEVAPTDNVRYLPDGQVDPASVPPPEETWMRRSKR